MEDILNSANLIRGTIAVEGYPFSGKTTYIMRHFSQEAFIVPDHMLIPSQLPKFVLSDWSDNPKDILKRQDYFLNLEIDRCSNIVNSKFKYKVMDRCVLSIIVYLLSRIKNNPLKKEILESFYKKLNLYIQEQKIFLPEKIIFIETDFKTICKRMENNERNCESFFMSRDIFDEIINSYKKILSQYYTGKVEYIKGE